MTHFGLTAAEIRSAVSPVTPTETNEHEALERFARAAWTVIAEPGDIFAGHLIRTLGADTALTGLVEGWSSTRFASEALSHGATLEDIDLSAELARWNPRVDSTATLKALRDAAHVNAKLLTPADTEWPVGLGDLGSEGPVALWVRGDPRHLRTLERSIALTGARAMSSYGSHVAMEAAAGLVERGFAITAGASFGIDAVAHKAALASDGVTVAFLPSGIDQFFPAGHVDLLNRIVEAGVVVSELPCGTAPTMWRLLQRNRLIAAASSAVVVVEAGWRSGALNTAGHATTLGRPLGAVPGPVTSPTAAGPHRLLRDFHATCVTNAEEMAELAPRLAPVAA